MNIVILGAAGFIGTNLTMKLAVDNNNNIKLVDLKEDYFCGIKKCNFSNVEIVTCGFSLDEDYDAILKDQDIVYHLVSTTIPTTSNQFIPQELISNVVTTSIILDACTRQNVKKVVFLSSGGTVYGKEAGCPLKEYTPTNPINSYGVQKITIEKLLYLYHHMYGLEYRIIRLSNPYGPFQRPNGLLGAVTTFTYKALKGEKIVVYGDGSVIRDFIYIDDAIDAIQKIVEGDSKHRTFNVGSGYGTSINELLGIVNKTLNKSLDIEYREARKVDVPVNYLDVNRYEKEYGLLSKVTLDKGICKTAEFLKEYYTL